MKRSLSILALLLLIVAVVFWAKRKIDRVPITRQVKLADVRSASITTSIDWPKGEVFHFVIGSNPTGSWNGSSSEGVIQIFTRSQLVSEFKFSHETTTSCNWIDKHQLQGTVLNWVTNWSFSKILTAGQTYDVTLIFSNPPPVDCSLWLTYVQSRKDFRAGTQNSN
jgi:hypothetical protein